jgi:hypothetical protein
MMRGFIAGALAGGAAQSRLATVPTASGIRRKVSGRTKEDVKDKLGKLHSDLEAGIRTPASRYTVGQAVEDWLHDGLNGRSGKTVTLYRQVLQPVVDCIGKAALRELTAQDVRQSLAEVARTRSSRTVGMAHNSLERAIRHAEADDKVRRNVAALVEPPAGQPGRPSRSLTVAWRGYQAWTRGPRAIRSGNASHARVRRWCGVGR